MKSEPLIVQWQPENWLAGWLTKYARSRVNHPAKIRFIRIWNRLLGRKVMKFNQGGRLAVGTIDYIDWALVTKGAFEPLSLNLAVKLMSENINGAVFLDVGAHHGLFSIAVGCATNCRVVSIEPSRDNFEAMVKNVSLNPNLNTSLVNCCASSSETLLQLTSEKDYRSMWTKVSSAVDNPQEPFVAGLRVDLILERLRVKKIWLLKIDVEGFELEVFRGLDWSGPMRPKYIIMECNPNEPLKRRFLEERDYRVRTVAGKQLENLKEYPEGNLFFEDERISQVA